MWESLSDDALSPRSELVYSIDPLWNYAAIRKDNFKIVVGPPPEQRVAVPGGREAAARPGRTCRTKLRWRGAQDFLRLAATGIHARLAGERNVKLPRRNRCVTRSEFIHRTTCTFLTWWRTRANATTSLPPIKSYWSH
ncbi:hypothetical protein MTO96_043550 [Rhipicephalus appendiculatus]